PDGIRDLHVTGVETCALPIYIEATGTIVNDDPIPTVTIDAGTLSVSHNEGNSGTTAYDFIVNLSNPSTEDITIHYSTSDGTASSDRKSVVKGKSVHIAGLAST